MASQATKLDEETGIERSSIKPGAQHGGFLTHRRGFWGKLAAFLSLVFVVSYLFVDVEPRHNGGSWYGYTLGTIGVILILWLTMLGVRKRAMTSGRWSLKAWTSAHVYLGMLVVFVATLHTGFQLGWNVHTLSWVLMIVVVLSGIFGITVYTILPSRMGKNRDETTEAQMLENVTDIDRQLFDAAQPLEADTAVHIRSALEEDAFGGRVWRRISGNYKGGATIRALTEIRMKSVSGDHPNDDLYDRLEALLSRKQAALSRIRRHLRYKALLQIWLYLHVPLTFALLAALSAHIVSVFFYW